MPPKKRVKVYKTEMYKLRKKNREKRERMTETEKNEMREKNRISAKIRRALMSPEEKEKVLEAGRKTSRLRWLSRKARPLEKELKDIEWRLKFYQKQAERVPKPKYQVRQAVEKELEELNQRKAELRKDIRTIKESPVSMNVQKQYKRTRTKGDTEIQIENEVDVVDKSSATLYKRGYRANMTEAQKNREREKWKIKAKIGRALMSPEEYERTLERQRNASYRKRKAMKIKSLEEELQTLKVQIETMEKSMETGDKEQLLKLKEQETDLELEIRTVKESQIRPMIRPKKPDWIEQLEGAVESTQEEDGNVDDAAGLADLTFQLADVAEGLVDLSEDEAQSDQKRGPDETVEDWIRRMENQSTNPEKGNSPLPEQSTSQSQLNIPPRRGRLAAMKARATLSKLRRSYKANATLREKKELQDKIAYQQKLILQLMEKYPEEFNMRKPGAKAPNTKQKSTPVMVNGKVKGYALDGNGKRKYRFAISKRETEEERLARITAMFKLQAESKSVDLANEAVEKQAAEIIRKVEEHKNKIKTKGRPVTVVSRSKWGIKAYERQIETNIIDKWLATPEQTAERKAKIAADSRQRNHMEKGEYKIFQILIASDDPLKSLQAEESAPTVLQYYYHCITATAKERKVPEVLKEYRKKAYLLLNESLTGPIDESENEKTSRVAAKNADLKQWLSDAVNLEPLTEYLNERKSKMPEYYRNRSKNEKANMLEEEKEARRKATNEKCRRYYQKKKLEQGIVIVPKGERAQPNKNFNMPDSEVPKPRIERKPRGSKAVVDSPKAATRKPRSRNRKNEKDSINSDIAPPPIGTYTTRPVMSPGAINSNRWSSLSLAMEVDATTTSESQLNDDDDNDDDDDWMPVSHFSEAAYVPQNPNYIQPGSFGSQFAGVHQPNLTASVGVSTLNDDFFHRLIHVPTHSNSNSFVPQNQIQMPMYPGLTGIENSSFGHSTHFQQFQPHQTQPWGQNPSQSMEVPLNYSISYLPTNSQVTLISETSHNSLMPRSDNSQDNISPSTVNADHAQIMEISSNVDVQTSNPPVTKIKKTRRPRGQGPSKRPKSIRAKKPKGSPRSPYVYIPKNAVKVTPSEPKVLKPSKIEYQHQYKCLHCPSSFDTQEKYDCHNKKRHEVQDVIQCPIPMCSQAQANKIKLVRHMWCYHRRSFVFHCPICSAAYRSKRRFLSHLQAHPMEKNSYFCSSFCNERLAKNKDVNYDYNKFWCDLCPSFFESSFKLISHRQAHTYICKECGILMKDADHLLDHTFRCHPDFTWTSTEEEYAKSTLVNETVEECTCKTCDSIFSTKEFLAAHRAAGHPKITKPSPPGQTCQSCDKKIKDHHGKNCSMLHYKCYWCTEKFTKRDLFLQHMASNHSEEKSIPKQIYSGFKNYKTFKCDFCRNSFNSLLRLRAHIDRNHFPNPSKLKTKKVVEESIEKADVVPVATFEANANTSKSDANSTVLRTEVVAQTETQTPGTSEDLVVHPCHVCNSLYKTKEFLEKHIAVDHPDASKHLRIVCDICNKSISFTSSLLRHKNAYHNDENRKTYQCPQCPMKSTRPEHLRSHVRNMHENGSAKQLSRRRRPDLQLESACKLCSVKLANPKILRRHERVVHFIGVVPYFCDVCGVQQQRQSGKQYINHYKQCHQGQLPPADPHLKKVTTFTSENNLGTILQRVPLQELLRLIDELYKDGEYYGMRKRSATKIRARKARKRSQTKKKSTAASDSSDPEDSDGSSESSSEDDWLSGDSSDGESNSAHSDVDCGTKNKSPRISLRNVVIKPTSRRKVKSPTSYRSNRLKAKAAINAMPSIILERCDELYKSLQNERRTSDQVIRKSSKPTKKRTSRYVAEEEENSEESESDEYYSCEDSD